MPDKHISVESLTAAFQEFTKIVDGFQQNNQALQNQIQILNQQLETKNFELQEELLQGENIRKFLDNILQNIYSGVIVIDNNANISVFNKAAEAITGHDYEHVIGENYTVLSGMNRINKISALLTLKTGNEARHLQKTITTCHNDEKNIEYSTTVLRNPAGEPVGVAEIFNDISELKELQNRVMHIETLAALGEMAASVAHEIRNPLGGITGFVGLLERKVGNENKNLISPIKEGVKRLENIVSNLLSYTRHKQISSDRMEIKNLLFEVMNFFQMSKTNAKPYELSHHFPDKNVFCMADKQLLHQVVLNLLENAYDAIDEDGNISLTLSTHDIQSDTEGIDSEEIEEIRKLFSFIKISIQDNGRGISPENIFKLFRPFYSTKEKGNGLGLSVCKKIINLHRGDIQVKSKENMGTTFVVTLPIYQYYD